MFGKEKIGGMRNKAGLLPDKAGLLPDKAGLLDPSLVFFLDPSLENSRPQSGKFLNPVWKVGVSSCNTTKLTLVVLQLCYGCVTERRELIISVLYLFPLPL